MASAATELAHWAAELRPSTADLALADRALTDTVAAREHPTTHISITDPHRGRHPPRAHGPAARLSVPPAATFTRKIDDCLTGTGIDPRDIGWASSAAILRTTLRPDNHPRKDRYRCV